MDEWEAILMVEGSPTGDGRFFDLGATGWRDLPLTLLYMPATDDGHDGSFPIGSITSITRVSTGKATANIVGRGTFVESEEADVLGAIDNVRTGTVRGVSVDVGLDLFMLAPFDEGVSLVTEDGEEVTDDPDQDDDGEIDDPDLWLQIENVVTLRVQEATIMAATVVPTPAFAEALIEPLAEAALVAAAVPSVPPAEWFADPHLAGPTPMTIQADGRIYGHLAAWGSCHIGMPGCFQAPTSPTAYSMFRLGERETDGGPVPVGQITLDTNHAGLALSGARAREHYEHTGAAVADVSAGEDEYGIWVAGSLRPGLPEDRLVELRAAKLSGDWRDQGQGLDLVGALAVNIPGYPIPRGLVAGGDRDEVVSLVSAGALRVGMRSARVAGRFTKVRVAGGLSNEPLPVVHFVGGIARPTTASNPAALAALADRVHGPDLDRLAARASGPELARLAERV